jgi:hypothetical protein
VRTRGATAAGGEPCGNSLFVVGGRLRPSVSGVLQLMPVQNTRLQSAIYSLDKMDETRKELECALYASVGVSLSVYPYVGPVANLCLAVLAAAIWILVRIRFAKSSSLIRRTANHNLFWILAIIGGGPMVLSRLNGRALGAASFILPFLMAGVSAMAAQIRDLLQPWPEELVNFHIEAKTFEHQLCLAYFQTSGGMIPTVFAGVLIFSLWMQWDWGRMWNPQYFPVLESVLSLYSVLIYVLCIVQPGLERSKDIRREIMTYQASKRERDGLAH